jgi:hypothetical protein
MPNNPRTIILKGNPQAHWEYPATAGVTPGHLLYVLSTGKVGVHNAAGGTARKMFATENALLGKGIDDAYVANDLVQCADMPEGSMVYAWVPAGAAAIVVGDKLASNGDGALKKAAASSQLGSGLYTYTAADEVVAEAAEAIDNSAGGAAVRIRAVIR